MKEVEKPPMNKVEKPPVNEVEKRSTGDEQITGGGAGMNGKGHFRKTARLEFAFEETTLLGLQEDLLQRLGTPGEVITQGFGQGGTCPRRTEDLGTDETGLGGSLGGNGTESAKHPQPELVGIPRGVEDRRELLRIEDIMFVELLHPCRHDDTFTIAEVVVEGRNGDTACSGDVVDAQTGLSFGFDLGDSDVDDPGDRCDGSGRRGLHETVFYYY